MVSFVFRICLLKKVKQGKIGQYDTVELLRQELNDKSNHLEYSGM